MEQLATVKKAELTGSKPVTKAILFYGCQKMFQDAASSFENCGSSAFAYAQQCNVGPRRRCEWQILAMLCEIKALMNRAAMYEALMNDDGDNCGLALGMVSEARVGGDATLRRSDWRASWSPSSCVR